MFMTAASPRANTMPDRPPKTEPKKRSRPVSVPRRRVVLIRLFMDLPAFSGRPPVENNPVSSHILRLYLRMRSELVTTDTELKAIAAPAIMGLKRNPVNGYRTPAAMGMPSVL